MQNSFELLMVPQFTLYSVLKGNKPDFHKAMDFKVAQTQFDKLVEELRN